MTTVIISNFSLRDSMLVLKPYNCAPYFTVSEIISKCDFKKIYEINNKQVDVLQSRHCICSTTVN